MIEEIKKLITSLAQFGLRFEVKQSRTGKRTYLLYQRDRVLMKSIYPEDILIYTRLFKREIDLGI